MSSSNIEFKSNPGQIKIDEAQGIVECFVAGIGNKDSVGDVLVPGAFTESLKRRKPRVVWGHNWNDPIGKVLEIYEVGPGDPRLPMKMKTAGIGGLYARVQFNLNSEKGREAFANVAFFGLEQEWSIGYKTINSSHDPAIKANILREVELYEVSPVLHGANQLTGTISVKSDDQDEKCGPMMGMNRIGAPGMSSPNIVVVSRREDDDEEEDDKYESEKPIFAEGLAQPIGGSQRQRLEREIASRTGSRIQLLTATENTATFRKYSSDGTERVYRVSYHTPDNWATFMFGKPELADGQTSGSRVVVPSQMPMMPMQVKPNESFDPSMMDERQDPYMSIPKQDGFEKSAIDESIEFIESFLYEDSSQKVGKTINRRNLSKLKSIIETLQEIISTSEKDLETKSDYVIPVSIENAFRTKQFLDPIFDYHRVESEVTENGIVIKSQITSDFVNAVDTAFKSIGGTIGGGIKKGRRAASGMAARFDPNAWDGDGDGVVQEGTPFRRPAIPGVNDRSTGGRVNAEEATRAFRQQGGGGLASRSNDVTREVERTGTARWPGRGTPSPRSYEQPSSLSDSEEALWDELTSFTQSELFKELIDRYDFDEESFMPYLGKAISNALRPDHSGKDGEIHKKLEKEANDIAKEIASNWDDADIASAIKAANPGNSRAARDADEISSIKSMGDRAKKIRELMRQDSYALGYEQNPAWTISNAMARNWIDKDKMSELDDSALIKKASEDIISDVITNTNENASPSSTIRELIKRNDRMEKENAKKRSGGLASRSSGVDNDLNMLAERLRGDSLADVADRYGMDPKNLRQNEIQTIRKLQELGEDGNILAERLGGSSLSEVAKKYGKKPEDVRQAELRAIKKLRGGDVQQTSGLASRASRPLGMVGTQEISDLISSRPRGLKSQNLSVDRGVSRYAKKFLEENSDMEDQNWIDSVVADLDSGKITPQNASRLMNLIAMDMGEQFMKPESSRDMNVIEERQKLAKKLRRVLVDSLSPEELDALRGFPPSRRRGLASQSRGEAEQYFGREKMRRVEDTILELRLMDKMSLNDAASAVRDIAGGDMDARSIRQAEINALARLRRNKDPLTILDYSLSGMNDDELSRLFDMSPEEIKTAISMAEWDIGVNKNAEQILHLRTKHNMSLDDVAERFGLSRQEVRQLELGEIQKRRQLEPGFVTSSSARRPAQSSRNSGLNSGRVYGVKNPHNSIKLELSKDESDSLKREAQSMLAENPNDSAVSSLVRKLNDSTDGKVELSKEEVQQIGKITEENNSATGIQSVLGSAIDSPNGQYSSPSNTGRTGLRSAGKPNFNNGAPSDISEAMQKELIFWAKRNQNLVIARRITENYDKNDGKLKASEWRSLETMFNNLSPRGRRGGLSSRSGRVVMDETGEGNEPGGIPARGLGQLGGAVFQDEDLGVGGRPVGTEIEDKRSIGKKFEEVKPNNWESLDLEEKYDWLFGDGHPTRSGISEFEYNKQLRELFDLEERRDRKSRREPGLASRSNPNGNGVIDGNGVIGHISSIKKRLEDNKDTLDPKIYEAMKEAIAKTGDYFNPRVKTPRRIGGLASSSSPSKSPRTTVTSEATFFKEIEKMLPTEIDKSRADKNSSASKGLQALLDIIRRQEASKTGDKRTNVGTIFFTADEADQILEGLMYAVDRQLSRDNSQRAEIIAKAIDLIADAAMSTFVSKTSKPAGPRKIEKENERGRTVQITNTDL